jgi:flagellar basal-body rod modification protein FlgD
VIDAMKSLTVSSPAAQKAAQAAADKASQAAGLTPGASGLGQNAFLQLLITQLGNQNPLKPQEDGQFIAQMAQFSSLEQLTQIQQTLTQVATALGAATLPSKS